MTERRAKISARTLLELMAGRLDQSSFLATYGQEERNIFFRQLREGRTIANIYVEKSENPEDDDEWVVFEFGETDPAIAPFTVPESKNRS